MGAHCTKNGDRPHFSHLRSTTRRLTQRGNNRGSCFFTEGDYLGYLSYLQYFAERSRCAVHAYCLMGNHVHLLITPAAADGCGLLMKHLGQCYVQHVNRTHGRTGTLWEGRFHSCLVSSERYVLACYRYVESNPVRAGLVSRPEQYRWSSYGRNARGHEDQLLSPHPAYLGLADETKPRLDAYRSLFEAPLPRDEADEIRKATRGGFVVGSRRRGRGRPSRKMGSVPIF